MKYNIIKISFWENIFQNEIHLKVKLKQKENVYSSFCREYTFKYYSTGLIRWLFLHFQHGKWKLPDRVAEGLNLNVRGWYR